jgi:hypothetical protein
MASMTDLTAGDPAEVDKQQLGLDAVDEQLIDRLAARARAGGLQLAGEGELLQQLTQTAAGVRARGRAHRPPGL